VASIERIEYGVAAGWRTVHHRNGTVERITATELQHRYGIDPFTNIHPTTY